MIAPSVAAAERGLARDSCIRVCAWGAHARHIGIVVENESLQHAGCTDLQLAQAADVRKHSDAVPQKRCKHFLFCTIFHCLKLLHLLPVLHELVVRGEDMARTEVEHVPLAR